MKKRRIASTRHMNKDDRRRLQLNKGAKNQTGREIRSKRVMFAKADVSANFVRRDVSAAKTPLSKRTLALVLAVIMVLSLVPLSFFLLRPKAAKVDYSMGPVTMNIRVNGKDLEETATVKAGAISADTIDVGDIQLPEGANYVKALLVDRYTRVETPIYAVGSKGSTNYYSINKDGFTGVEQTSEDELVLVFANKYNVEFNADVDNSNLWTVNDFGTFRTNATKDGNDYFVYGGENLRITEITPFEDRAYSKVTYSTYANGVALNSGSETIKNNSATIPADMYSGDTIRVNVNFNAVSNYSVQDARYMNGSKYYANYKGIDNHGGVTENTSDMNSGHSLDAVRPGETADFYVYSQKNSSIGIGAVWRLAMMSVNGVNLSLPNDDGEEGSYAETPFREGDNNKIKVTFVKKNATSLDGNNRVLYKVEVPNVHENLEVNYYFTNIKERKIILTGLRGIKQTAAAVENEPLLDTFFGRYYTYDSNKQNVYSTFNDRSNLFNLVSANLVAYTVKQGYNPYSYTYKMFYNNVEQDAAIRMSDKAGTVDQVIVRAGNNEESGNFNTDYRYWGKTDNTEVKNYNTAKYNRNELLLTTLDTDTKKNGNIWYGIALNRATSTNQQLYLNINPYPYALALDPNQGTMFGSSDTWVDPNTFTVESTNALFVPSEKPVRNGYIFKGWRLVSSSNDETINGDEYLYQPSDRVYIDSTTIDNAFGVKTDSTNQTVQQIKMRAEWEESQTAYTTTVTVNAFKQTDVDSANENAPIYSDNLISDNTETQIANIKTALLDDKTGLMSDAHYVVGKDTTAPYKTSTDGSNVFSIYYDYRLEDLTVTNTVLGYPDTKLFPVTITFAPDEPSPVVPLTQAATIMSDGVATATADADNNKVVYQRNMAANDTVTLKVPYGWTYSISVAANAEDYSTTYDPSNEGTVKDSTEVEITNIDASSGVETNKYISGPDENGKYTLTLEAWANRASFTKPKKEASTTPLDIALVVDQSGSMTTGDMGTSYAAVTSDTNWSIKDVAEYGETLFYRVGSTDKYYPVLMGEGTLYEAAEPIAANKMFGGGHDSTFGLDGIGSTPHFNVKTDYYYPDANNVMHQVFFITIGSDLHYCAYPYYYSSLNDPYEKYDEWEATSATAWGSLYDYVDGGDRMNRLTASKNRYWGTIVSENRVRLVPKNGTAGGLAYNGDNFGYRSANPLWHFNQDHGVHYSYAWGSNAGTVKGMYQVKEGTTYNYLYYIDDSGNKVSLNKAPSSTGATIPSSIDHTVDGNTDYVVYTDDQTAYNGTLYKATGVTRLKALQDAVKDFTTLVASNAQEYQVDHRISLIGFAGNGVPALSGTGHYNYSGWNSKWDYVNTGLYLPGAESYTWENGQKNTSVSGFKNYITLDGSGMTQTNERYINKHYYVAGDSSQEYYPQSWQAEPVIYNGSSWVNLNGQARGNYTFYKPETLTELSDEDYANSLVSVSQKDVDNKPNGTVNSFVTSSINNFGAYGGTYTSYGMAMANQVLAQANRDSRKIIIVFTDGEPGANGFENNIAGEALADGGIAKNNGYEVYTVGLYKTNPGDAVNNFMKQLSSQYSISQTDYYAAEGNPTAANNHGLGNGDKALDNTQTYYYTKDGKTYAVNAIRRGVSSLGWWKHGADGTYTLVTPVSTDSGAGSEEFYENGSRINGANANTDKVYQSSSGENIYYEYRWYDTDNNIVIPKSGENSEGAQFFQTTMTNLNPGTPYYYQASDEVSLKAAFQSISDSVYSTTTVMRLGSDNSELRDFITDKFTDLDKDNITIATVEGKVTGTGDNQTITWLDGSDGTTDTTTDITSSDDIKVDGNNLRVLHYDYSGNYIAADRPSSDGNGKKIVVTISGLTPTQTGFNLTSNETTSGVYELLHENDDISRPLTGEVELLKDFPVPEVNRPEYKLVVDGDDKTAKYGVSIQFKHGNDYVEDADLAKYLDEDTLQHLSKNGNTYILWSGVSSENGKVSDSAVLENIFKQLPPEYTVLATVSKSDTTPEEFTYTVTRNGKASKDVIFDSPFVITPNNTSIEITSKRKTQNVVIRKLTVATDESNDYTDTCKKFDIKVKLLDARGHEVNESLTYGDTVYDENGELVLSLRHDQSRVIEVPSNYCLEVQEVDKAEYEDDYFLSANESELGDKVGETKAEVQISESNAYNRITVQNTLDTTPQTGVLDHLKFAWYIWVAIGVCLIAAAWFVVYERRRRMREEQ